jgi:hypothetical protein
MKVASRLGYAEYLAVAFREGDDLARLLWADALEDAGDRKGALAVRALPALLEHLQEGAWALNHGSSLRPFKLGLRLGCSGGWSEEVPGFRCAWPPGPIAGNSKTVGVLVSRWNDFHPAIEWLARSLQLTMVELSFSRRPASLDRQQQGPFSLRRRHLLPLPGCVVCDCLLRTPRS